MLNRSSKRTRAASQLGKLAADIVTRQAGPDKPDKGKDPAAVALGRKGGLKGGKARAYSLSRTERVQIAKHAAQVRWRKTK